ncbi:MAG: MFS transporter, partial [Actinobacteria bacterium]|nr:MFS transporter [Actinomycetota bacterium]
MYQNTRRIKKLLPETISTRGCNAEYLPVAGAKLTPVSIRCRGRGGRALKSSLRVPFAVLTAVPFVMVLGNSMLIPVLPQMKSAMGITPFQVGLVITAFSLPAGILIPFAGFLSDRVGRKTIMAPALLIYGLGGDHIRVAALFLRSPYAAVLAGRVVQGIGAGGTYQLAMALTGDLFASAERSKALGGLEAANGMGKVISPVAGAAAALVAWFLPFFVYSAVAIPVGIAVWFLVKDPSVGEKQPAPLSRYGATLKKIVAGKGVPLGVSYLAGMVALFILFGVLSYISDVLEDRFGMKGVVKGLVIAIPVLGSAVTSYLSGVYMQKRLAKLSRVLVGTGLFLVAASLAVIAVTEGPYLFYASMLFIGAGTGSVLPSLNTLITSAAGSAERGLVTALYGTVRFFGVAMGPPAFNWGVRLGEP